MTQTKDAENAALNRPQKDISLKYEKLETSKYLCSTSAGKVDFRQLIFFPHFHESAQSMGLEVIYHFSK